MADPDRLPLDFPGFLRTVEGGYVKHEDFVTFVAGASSTKTGDVKERAIAWLRRQGVTGPIEALSPAEVSRLIGAAQKVIVARSRTRTSGRDNFGTRGHFGNDHWRSWFER